MERDYTAPQLVLAGDVREVVLGGFVGGADLSNQAIVPGGGFLADEEDGDYE